jgi:hypothetical protein
MPAIMIYAETRELITTTDIPALCLATTGQQEGVGIPLKTYGRSTPSPPFLMGNMNDAANKLECCIFWMAAVLTRRRSAPSDPPIEELPDFRHDHGAFADG